MLHRLTRLILLVLLVLALDGCGYYAQSIRGQWELISKRQPIEALLADPQTPVALREQLRRMQQIRRFANVQLALPDNGSYRDYADLGRPFVVWNVFAARPLSMRLETWCFPVAGCVGYRGYFDETEARAYAATLTAQGLETYVAGISAYSTLGWFDDPLLNTVMGRSETRLAGLIFHELAHQRVYVQDDTAFNEAFASAVEQEGVRRWLAQNGGEQQEDARFRRRQNDFVDLVTATRDRLAVLYASELPEAQQHTHKAQIIGELRAGYAALKRRWGGYAGYDAWFSGPLNNPQLAAVTTYRDGVPAFQALLREQGGDLEAFYRAVEALGELSVEERQARLRDLSAAGLGHTATLKKSG
ncbi:MAG TPA: aminopeptidase [Gammaproteobacteria bacterium]|nr:aminopeptidase [Gammaproteobacteria bacterium]